MPFPKSTDPIKQETFLEFVEKLVMLDVLIEPYMYEHFIQYDSFPFDIEGYMGNETALLNVFTFWKHYQGRYLKELADATIIEEDYNEWLIKEGQIIKDEVTGKEI